ncbi:MAG: hypothetical protein MSIBF_02250 [Candidatus Altiarchaeales archaeon IMC4]|nr:MAG: hypothetical protein MSIBF_02250 [Candidatus Altiarchaeales archaeon IMC4]
MIVIKFGGSLFKNNSVVNRIVQVLEEIAKKQPILIIPGGGIFADAVRQMDKNLLLEPETAHELAIKAMDMTAVLLTKFSKKFRIVDNPDDAEKNTISVLLASGYAPVKKLRPSWDATSDSIAALVAGETKAEKCVLLKSVDGIYSGGKLIEKIKTSDLKKLKQSCVDKALPDVLDEYRTGCFIVNGNHPERIQKMLNCEKPICTEITPSG